VDKARIGEDERVWEKILRCEEAVLAICWMERFAYWLYADEWAWSLSFRGYDGNLGGFFRGLVDLQELTIDVF
jgi:hypothetical protein